MDFTTYVAQALARITETVQGLLPYQAVLSQLPAALHGALKQEGTIYIAADEISRFSADHLAEELQVRYTAGKPFGRNDREAVAALSLTSYPESQLAEIVGQLKATDFLIVFVASAPSPWINAALVRAQHLLVPTLLIGHEREGGALTTIEAPQFCLPISGESRAVTCVMQRVFLHALCEMLEPEWKPGTEVVQSTLNDSLCTFQSLHASSELCNAVDEAREILRKEVAAGGRLYFIGNGGSACDAEDLRAVFSSSKKQAVLAFTFLQPGYLTCAINDGFEVFRRGIEGIRGDRNVLVAISTGGSSENVNRAVELANQRGAFTLGLSGKGGGTLAQIAQKVLIVPSDNTARIQEAHLLIGNYLAED